MGALIRRGRVGLVLLAAVLIAAACEVPLVNPPPGGGEIVTETLTLDYYTIPPGGQEEQVVADIDRPAGSFGLVGLDVRLVDENGEEIDDHMVHLHHVVFTNDARKDRLCPGRNERFGGTGNEFSSMELEDPYAYLVGEDDSWGANFHLMNNHGPGGPTITMAIEYTLRYQPEATPENVRGVTPYYMDVTGCGNSEYDIPGSGGNHVLSRSWTLPQPGIAVYTYGHLHEGGKYLRLIGPFRETICKAEAVYGMGHHPESVGSCTLHYQVWDNATYKVESVYDNSEPIDDVMGIMQTYVWHGVQ